jgi:hypothetical protein
MAFYKNAPLLGMRTVLVPERLGVLKIYDRPLLSALPALPKGLQELYINDCPMLSALPALPEGLTELYIENCPMLSALPALPEGLKGLKISCCHELSALPALPAGLRYVDIFGSHQLSALPALPKGLRNLEVDFNNKVILTRKQYQKARLRILVKQAVLEWWLKPEQMQKLVAKYGDPAKAYAAIGLGYG